ncbi:type II toxin-antitoxin system RelE/ParE family toxin [Pseudomonas sp. H3(2019)]|uniref:type II toxin-antitoxin system RelE/ParE family toxin n=1 Tax=Pseudomonas sp. H3(2019) TaxID=2598724 RepID=UPI001196035E|nr:type II toxin-antitoxin system RelE/ParE family toxin [Pseudomonas sp. H3(2019)]TVT79325.1 type II toxin-antitoxin system RelE/ParE family toxin [Pseudomonas sp. H3(2019)]
MRQLLFSAMAREDLQNVVRYIARDNPARARTFVDELRQRCLLLVEQPDLGVAREDRARGLRMIAHGRYLIFYGLTEQNIQVERVLQGARDLGRLFESGSQDQ